MGILTLVWISVLIPKLNTIVRFNDVTSEAFEWAVPKTPSNSLLTLTLLLISSTLRTNILSVVIPKTSLAAMVFLDKSPVTDKSVTIPVAPVVPIPVLRSRNDVLNPIWCLPSNCLRVSVDKPDIVTISPTIKSCGCDDNPTTFPVWLL